MKQKLFIKYNGEQTEPRQEEMNFYEPLFETIHRALLHNEFIKTGAHAEYSDLHVVYLRRASQLSAVYCLNAYPV